MSYVIAAKSVITHLWLFAIFGIGCCQDVSNNSYAEDVSISKVRSPFSILTETPRVTINTSYPRLHRRDLPPLPEFCWAPGQPPNGMRKLHANNCDEDNICEIDRMGGVEVGKLLNYTCNPGYKLVGNPYVLCQSEDNWAPIPVCIDVTCDPLNSASTIAKCFRLGRWVNCDSPVLHGTRGKISCRPGYMPTTSSITSRSENVECTSNGKWEPEPIRCVAGCGVAPSEFTMSLPWTAFLYKRFSENGKKLFTCGATIISTNLLLTAAGRCVYEHSTNTTTNPANLFIMAGETLRDYDDPHHNFEAVWQRAVKNVYIHCDYLDKRSTSDIALIEIQKPFELSTILVPVCLDLSDQILEPGVKGSIVEFGKTAIKFRPRNRNYQSIKTVPYVPYEECKTSDKISDKAGLTSDKFCAGYTNRSTECIDDHGSGLMFKRNNLWYIGGVVNTVTRFSISNSERSCDDYIICTNISQYTAWIEDVIFNLERYDSNPACDGDRSQLVNTIAISTTVGSVIDRVLSNVEDPVCLAPLQPSNGEWRLYGNFCGNSTNCVISEGTELKPGNHLVYSCAPGYKASGSTDVYCESGGNWSIIPVCNEIKCDSLNSVSRRASCNNRSGEWVSCDSSVSPGTQARVSCHLGYKPESSFATFGGETVKCNEDGEWVPAVIRCVPVCGIPITHQTALVYDGVRARISDFPWHATLYVQKNASDGAEKRFICGATIIHSNFLLTAAHCVYDEATRTTEDPKKFFVMTGNVFRDYDSSFNNRESVKKSAVKNIWKPCYYYGLRGNYALDIALIELQQPYEFSRILSPACLDVEGLTKQILEPGAQGKVAGFGRTQTGDSSAILQTLTLPYVSYSDCKTPKSTNKNDVFISSDKFCAGYTNGSAVCQGDSGGGLVFRKSELWYVLGIVSVGLDVDIENGEKTCDRYSYSLYTKVSEHMPWIQYVISKRARNEYPSCETAV